MRPLRVGRIAALNMFPVYHGLESVADEDITFLDGVPTRLNRALLGGEVDVSAVSSIAYARNAERLDLMPVASITADGAVDSIQVFSRVPFEEIRSVAVTPDSATSVALLQVLAAQSAPSLSILDDSPEEALEHADGVLLIGDEALEGLRRDLGAHRTDLAELWRQRTGLPMVFAVWAARREVASARPDAIAALAERLREAIAAYAADPEPAMRAAAARFPFPREFIEAYLARLRYEFGPSERAGLERFLEMSRSAGLLEQVPRLAA